MRRRALFLIQLFAAPASVAAHDDVVFERGTELGFLFVRSGILSRRRLLEDLYSFL